MSPADDSAAPDPRRPRGLAHTWMRNRISRWLVAFVRRQIAPEVTRGQVVWDVVLGALAPLFILWLDRAWDPAGVGGLAPGTPHPGVFAGFGALAVVAFHALRARAPMAASLSAGPLAATAVAAAGIGLIILPWSLLGLIFVGVGLLGFTPFVVALTHVRCAIRAWRMGAIGSGTAERSGSTTRKAVRAVVLVAGLTATLAGGVLLARYVRVVARRAEQVALGEIPGDADAAIRRLSVLWLWPGIELPVFAERYGAASTDEELDELEAKWRRISGQRSVPHSWFGDF